MDPTLKFVIFSLVGAAAIVAGRFMRTGNVVSESFSRSVHLFTVIFLWSPISVIAFWAIPINRELLAIMLIQPFVMVAAWLITAGVARAARISGPEIGVVIVCSALSNQGFTLGAYLCFVLLEPGQQALSYAVAFVTAMQVFMVLIFYPVARHYELAAEAAAGTAVDHPSLGRLIVGSFLDIRAMPLYGAAAGALLSLFGPAYPQWLTDHPYVLDIGFFLGAIGSYSGIGLRLRFGDSLRHLRHHAVIAVVKFIAMPAITLAVLMAMKRIQPIGDLPSTVVILSSFTPSAINAVIIANLFHLNARLAAVLWLGNTILYLVVVLPIIIAMI